MLEGQHAETTSLGQSFKSLDKEGKGRVNLREILDVLKKSGLSKKDPRLKNFYEKIQWPKGNKSLLKDQEITLVVQINGKKRGLFVTKKDLPEKKALMEAKKIENIKKNLKDKKIVKNIFVKNKIINYIVK